MALLSSAGPTADGRIKPDVCAPGTDIVGPRSSLATGRGWGPVEPGAALHGRRRNLRGGRRRRRRLRVARQAWRTARTRRAPAGPALKALAVVGRRPGRDDATAPGRRTGSIAGFGRLDVGESLPPTHGRLRRHGAACCATPGGRRRPHRQQRTYACHAAAKRTGCARCCAGTTPGRALRSTTSICRSPAPARPPVWGNHPPAAAAGSPTAQHRRGDRHRRTAAGTWHLTVTGAPTSPSGRQPFSLVVQGRTISSSH